MKPSQLIQTLKNYFWHLPQAIFWNLYYGFPSHKITLIGITGTDGKTTITHTLEQLLKSNHIPCSLISTLTSSGLHTTSPNSRVIQQFLHQSLQQGITHAILEVTSHSLDQYRFWGCRFHIGILTNTSHEHLDYHSTFSNYVRAKTRLFTNSQISILNRDDPSFSTISHHTNRQTITYSIRHRSDYQAKEIQHSDHHLQFTVNHLPILTNTPYRYQVYNILACYAAAKQLGISDQAFQKFIARFPLIKGRREEIQNSLGIRCIVDFAHTPQALKQTLLSLRPSTRGRLIVVFGATGGRDKSKRLLMGATVASLADIAIITSDDTRHENIFDISRQIAAGFPPKFDLHLIPSRQQAINYAIKRARQHDTVIACGKGHETSILHGSIEYPWSDSQAFFTAIKHRPHV